MLYVHEANIENKINQKKNSKGKEVNGYKNLRPQLEEFRDNIYYPFRQEIEALTFDEKHRENFNIATKKFNEYKKELENFVKKYEISNQSKFVPTFLEEISSYLFKDIKEIKNNTYGIFNKKIFAGLIIEKGNKIKIIHKDVDFCIAKKSSMKIDNEKPLELFLPIISVEVKTYLDATMFGEVKSSSKAIRNATPNSKTYVLMGHKKIADEHIILAKTDSSITEMFALMKINSDEILADVVYDYWKEIKDAVEHAENTEIPTYGRLLKLKK